MTIGMARGLTLAELGEEECTNASTAPRENVRRLGNHATQRGERVRRCRVGFGSHLASEAGRPAGVPSREIMTSHGIPYPWLRLLRREVEDLVRIRCGERYLRERKAWTELAQINRELKLLQAQLAALEERRPTLLPTSPNKVIIKRDQHVGLRDKVDLATPPTGGVPQARRRAAPDRRTHPDPHRSRTTGSSSLRHPPRSGGHGPS
jgi:hypothetical protein